MLDIGCGEGQVARRVAELGADVVGLDPSATQVLAAHGRAGRPRYARARAEALPCRNDAFDAVVVCLAFEHVDAIDLAIARSRAGARAGRPVRDARGAPSAPGPEQRLGRRPEHRRALLAHRCVPRGAGRDRRSRARREAAVRAPSGQSLRASDRRRRLAHRRRWKSPRLRPRSIRTLWQFPEAATIPRILLLRARR